MNLYVSTLGIFDLELDGQSILKDFGRSYRILKLLHYLISFRGKKLMPASIIDSLFQDSRSFDPSNMLRAQIFRLRQSLKTIIPPNTNEEDYISIKFYNGYYILEIGHRVILDIDIFEDLIETGDTFLQDDPEEAIEIYKKAMKIYEGHYLEEYNEGNWIFPIRNHYKRLYIKTLFKLLDLLKEKGEHEDIISLCEEALIHINEEEGIHLYLIEAMLDLGQAKNALKNL